jgi:hypothetical protein
MDEISLSVAIGTPLRSKTEPKPDPAVSIVLPSRVILVVEIDEMAASFACRKVVDMKPAVVVPVERKLTLIVLAVVVPVERKLTLRLDTLARRKYACVRFWFVAHGSTDIYKVIII